MLHCATLGIISPAIHVEPRTVTREHVMLFESRETDLPPYGFPRGEKRTNSATLKRSTPKPKTSLLSSHPRPFPQMPIPATTITRSQATTTQNSLTGGQKGKERAKQLQVRVQGTRLDSAFDFRPNQEKASERIRAQQLRKCFRTSH
jgi:hypothetical protein